MIQRVILIFIKMSLSQSESKYNITNYTIDNLICTWWDSNLAGKGDKVKTKIKNFIFRPTYFLFFQLYFSLQLTCLRHDTCIWMCINSFITGTQGIKYLQSQKANPNNLKLRPNNIQFSLLTWHTSCVMSSFKIIKQWIVFFRNM